jgi:hypothetical protein
MTVAAARALAFVMVAGPQTITSSCFAPSRSRTSKPVRYVSGVFGGVSANRLMGG